MAEDANQQLIADVIALTGGAAPEWNDAAAPTLQSSNDSPLYFVGVIGGKDVGKSSLINALLGQSLAAVTSTGEGTHRALAYVHREDAAGVRALLQAEIPDQFDLITHDIDAARRRVLVDLPDIDSIWTQHVDLTRRLLRHMLFPVWVQSIEKYADHQPMQLLQKVSAGNSPKNFLFVLTKADVLARRHGEPAVDELKADYAARLQAACGLEELPTVFAVNGKPGASATFDLQSFQENVLVARSEKSVADARKLARVQQEQSLKNWLIQQRVDERLAAARNLLTEAQSAIDARLTEPLVNRATAQLAGDNGIQSAVAEPVVRERLSYWPIVNIIDGVLGPIVGAFRSRGPAWSQQTIAGRDVAQQLRGVFSDLVQRDPQMLMLYVHEKLWENDPAEFAASRLENSIDTAITVHRDALVRTAGKPNLFTRLLAPVVTIGAALWFPIVQPILEIVLANNITSFTRQTVLLVVQLFGATYLLHSVGMLVIYFVALWMTLRWMAYRKIDRALRRDIGQSHPAGAVMLWSEQLVGPLAKHVERLQSLSNRITDLGVAERAAA